MKFKKYNSIENIYRKSFIDLIKKEVPSDTIFTVQEKIHGGNFSMHYGTNTDFKVLAAGRNGFFDDDTEYHFYQRILNKLHNNIIDLFNILNSPNRSVNNIAVYGELFGGSYEHPDVEKIKGISKINKGIFYSPDIEFMCFDIRVNGYYINLLEAQILCEKAGIPFDKIIFQGTLDECIEFGNEFESIIATELLGYPQIKDNICEGTVIKTLEPLYLKNSDRVIIKNKNSKWKEKTKKNRIKTEIKISETGQNILDELFSYITESRFESVISKIGTISDKDYGKLIGLYSKDVIEEFEKDNSFDDIEEKAEKKKIKQIFQTKVSELVRNKIQEYL